MIKISIEGAFLISIKIASIEFLAQTYHLLELTYNVRTERKNVERDPVTLSLKSFYAMEKTFAL